MIQRTYGVYGLMDYTINVRLGNRILKIPFTGGMTTANGVFPATYTTKNPVVQFAIESSTIFKNGKVKIVKSVGQAEEQKTAASKKKEAGTATPQNDKLEEKTGEKVVKVSCIEDAREYLVMNCGGVSSKLRYPKNINEYASQCGVTFEGL